MFLSLDASLYVPRASFPYPPAARPSSHSPACHPVSLACCPVGQHLMLPEVLPVLPSSFTPPPARHPVSLACHPVLLSIILFSSLSSRPLLCHPERSEGSAFLLTSNKRFSKRRFPFNPVAYNNQFSTGRLGTRRKCRVLAVTIVRLLTNAMAAIRRSASPNDVPCASNRARTSP